MVEMISGKDAEEAGAGLEPSTRKRTTTGGTVLVRPG